MQRRELNPGINPVRIQSGMSLLEPKRDTNLVTCRGTLEERGRLKILAKKYGFSTPSNFFRTCLDRLFEADAADDLALPIDLKRKSDHLPKPKKPKRGPVAKLPGRKKYKAKKNKLKK